MHLGPIIPVWRRFAAYAVVVSVLECALDLVSFAISDPPRRTGSDGVLFAHLAIYFALVILVFWLASRHFSLGQLAILAAIPSVIASIAVRIYGYRYVEDYAHDLQGYEPFLLGVHVVISFVFNLVCIGSVVGAKAVRARYSSAARSH